jgi:hypothetical protein
MLPAAALACVLINTVLPVIVVAAQRMLPRKLPREENRANAAAQGVSPPQQAPQMVARHIPKRGSSVAGAAAAIFDAVWGV